MITMKCSMHIGGYKKISEVHNHAARDFDRTKWNIDGHIDYDRTPLNVQLVDDTLIDFFDDTFGSALDSFNERNAEKHPDRLIGFDSTANYQSATPEERHNRAVKSYYNDHKKSRTEYIIQCGDHAEYWQMVAEIGQSRADGLYKSALSAAFEDFKATNPGFAVYNAVIHMDEVGRAGDNTGGTPHLHIDCVPIGTGTRGLTVKVSKDGALKANGYNREKNETYDNTAWKRWQRDYREHMEQNFQKIWNDTDVDVLILSSEPCHRRHKETYEWREEQRRAREVEGAISTLTEPRKGITGAVKGIVDRKKINDAANVIVANANAVAVAVRDAALEGIAEKETVAAANVQMTAQETAAAKADRAAAERLRTENERKSAELSAQENELAKQRHELLEAQLENQYERYAIDSTAQAMAQRMLKSGGYVRGHSPADDVTRGHGHGHDLERSSHERKNNR